MYIYIHTIYHWTWSPGLGCEAIELPRLLAGSPQDASETLKDATNNFILSKATDEDRDVKERFVDQQMGVSENG